MFGKSLEVKSSWFVPAAAVGMLALSACEASSTVDAASETTVSSEAPSPTTQAAANMLVFDALGGGSNVVNVYPGISEAEADKQFSGTYYDGDSVTAICKDEGRTVSSVAADGEEARTSTEWIRIQGTSNEAQYATAVYVENPEQLLGQLPDC